MDPATIAASVGALLLPYLKKIGEDFVGEAGSYVQEKAKLLWQKLRARLDGDPSAKEVLDRYETDPVTHGTKFQTTIQEKFAADKPLSDEISAQLAEIKRKAPYVRVVQRMTEAERILGVEAKRLRSGTIDLTQDFERAQDVTGVKLDDIG
jgi:hypothetical protein